MFGEISKKDKLIIYLRTAIKILRGGEKNLPQASQRAFSCRKGRADFLWETHHVREECKI